MLLHVVQVYSAVIWHVTGSADMAVIKDFKLYRCILYYSEAIRNVTGWVDTAVINDYTLYRCIVHPSVM